MSLTHSSEILIVSATHGRGWGAEEVLEHYLRAGAEVCVVAPQDSRFPGVIGESGQLFYPLSKSRSAFHQNIFAACKISKPPNIKLVHAWCARSVETAYILSRRLGAEFTVGLHDSPDQHYHSGARRKVVSYACHRAAAVATVSNAMAERCRALGLSNNPILIPNGIPELNPVPPRPEGRPVTIGFLGMNAERKGFRTVANWARRSKVRWRLYGDLDPAIETVARELLSTFPDRVTFCGRRPVQEIYSEVDIVVMPSIDFEPFGLVAVEAGRAGLPILASSVGGLNEIVMDGVTGYLYPETNPEKGFALLELLCEDEELREEMGKKGLERFESTYTVEKMKRGWNLFLEGQMR